MDKKVRIIVLGNYLEVLERPLRQKNVFIDCIINNCSPLAMAGKGDSANLKYSEDRDLPMQTLLNIRKNLSAMLSKDPMKFCQNYNLQPFGKEIRYQNNTEYIVVMNTSIGYSLFEKNGGVVYSDTWPQNQFITEIKANKNYIRQNFPFTDNFNWKYYYDKFIDAILYEYDREHIILIKVNSAQWYLESQEIKAFENRSSLFRNRIEQMDEYFLERTHCLCIEEQYNHIPTKKEACAFPYSSKTSYFYKRLEKQILLLLEEDIFYKRKRVMYTNPLTKYLNQKLSSQILMDRKEELNDIEENYLSLFEIKKGNYKNNRFFIDLIKLQLFLDIENGYTLSDYAIELLENKDFFETEIDIELIELYTKYLKLNINDIIAVYLLYLQYEKKECFQKIIINILENPDCLPVNAAKKFRNSNISFLKNYPYIQSELKEEQKFEKCFLPLGNNSYILIDLFSKNYMEKVDLCINKTVDYKKVIDYGYICPIESADALCSNYAFYIERARCSNGNKPVKIEFYDREDFEDTLSYIDYTDILENERFVISMAGQKIDLSDYRTVCNLSFLFKKNVKLCTIRSGLTDQICYYIFSKKLEEANSSILPNANCEIYYDDTFYLPTVIFNGLEITKFTKEDIQKKLITNQLSEKLLIQINRQMTFPDLLSRNGCEELDIITSEEARLKEFKYCSKIFLPFKNDKVQEFLKRKFGFMPSYYYCLVRPEVFMLTKYFELDKYIKFPEFDNKNEKIAEKMLSCDAVVIHIRLGDFVSCGWDVDNDYYIESIKKLLEIPDYENKKYFIFSDNIPWIKEHKKEYGFELLGDSEIIWIDHNKGEESYRDMQLMSLAKIIIASGSGMVRMAVVLSKRCEQYFSWKTEIVELLAKVGKKNKYTIGTYSKNYRMDYSKFAPKT